MDEADVSSDLYEVDPSRANNRHGKRSKDQGIQTTRYQISLPINSISISHDRRKKIKSENSCLITIRHKVKTSLEKVGEQLWRGSFILSDYLIYKRNDFHDCIAFEFGAGVGFMSIVASLLPFKFVYSTDYTQSIVDFEISNVEINSHLFAFDSSAERPPIYPRVLNWFDGFSCSNILDFDGWNSQDKLNLDSTRVLWLAADIIYDEQITEGFFGNISRLMKTGECLWLSVEKRFNFNVEEMSPVAHGYNRFIEYVEGSRECIYYLGKDERRRKFSGQRISLLIPQYLEYDRTKDIELWEITPAD
jgi:predicted nicotinamide N-methyase